MKRVALFSLLLTTNAVAAEPVLTFSFGNEKIDFSEVDIDTSYLAFDEQSKRPIVVIRMSAEKAAEFGLTTGRHIGETMTASVCGTKVNSARIMDAILGRYMQISGNFDMKTAQALAEQLKTSSCKQTQ
jgi:SecD/SecF fusion protein